MLTATDWAIYGRPLSAEEVDGDVPDQDATLFAAPFWVPLPPDREWVEGPATRPDVQEAVESQYGLSTRQFVELAVLNAGRSTAVRNVFNRVNVDLDVLREALGAEHFDAVDIHYGPPTLPIMPLSEAIAPDDFAERRNRLGPYITGAARESTENTSGQNRLSLEGIGTEIATALASKEDRRQVEQLSAGDVNNRGVFMAGTYNEKTGEIESLALADPTEAMLLAQKKTTVGERAACIKRVLDTNNKARPANSTRALFRNMTNHDIVLANAVARGLWSTVPREAMDGKHTEASIFALIPLFKV